MLMATRGVRSRCSRVSAGSRNRSRAGADGFAHVMCGQSRHVVLMTHERGRKHHHQSHDHSHDKVGDVLTKREPVRLLEVVVEAHRVVRAKPGPVSREDNGNDDTADRSSEHPPHAKHHGGMGEVVPLLVIGQGTTVSEGANEVPGRADSKGDLPEQVSDTEPGRGQTAHHSNHASAVPDFVFTVQIAVDLGQILGVEEAEAVVNCAQQEESSQEREEGERCAMLVHMLHVFHVVVIHVFTPG